MAHIGTWKLSEAAVKAAREEIDSLNHTAIQTCASLCKGGFTKPEMMRIKLKQLVSATGAVQMPEALTVLLRSVSKCAGLIDCVSDAVLATHQIAICAHYGIGDFELALAMTGRIQNLELLSAEIVSMIIEDDVGSEDGSELAGAICEPIYHSLGSTLRHAPDATTEDNTVPEVPKGPFTNIVPSAADAKGLTKLLAKLNTLKQDNRKKQEEAAAELEAAKLATEQVRGRLEKCELELKQTSDLLQKVEADKEAAIAKGVEEQVSAITRPWLKEPLAFESLATGFAEDFAAVSNLAEAALKAQTDLDKHTGNRVTVERQLQELMRLRAKLVEASKSALHPLPDLPKVIEQVEIHIKKHRELLAEKSYQPNDRVLDGLVAQINAAKDEMELERISKLAADLEGLGILKTFEKMAIAKARQRKLSIFVDSKQAQVGKDTASALRAGLANNRNLLFVVDGYNVLHLLPEVFGQAYEDGVPRGEARELLIEKMRQALKNSVASQCRIVFDGPEEKTVAVADNLVVCYSGGAVGIKNRADDAMIKHLKVLNEEEPALAKYVITSDGGLQQRAQGHNCYAVDVASFGAILDW